MKTCGCTLRYEECCGRAIKEYQESLPLQKTQVQSTFNFTWDNFDQLSSSIINNYEGSRIKLIVGITRGGLPLAVKLSHRLGIPMETLNWQTRDSFDKMNVKDAQSIIQLTRLEREYDECEVLFVDDICDSGETIRQIQYHFPKAKFTTLIDKIGDLDLVDYSPARNAYEYFNKWISFPWER